MNHHIASNHFVKSASGEGPRAGAQRMSRKRFRQLALFAALLIAIVAVPSSALAAPSASAYVVQPGDTLADIAWSLGVSGRALAEYNGIWNTDMIYVGQTLYSPGSSSYTTTNQTSSWTESSTSSSSGYSGGRWIEVDLSWQVLRAYEGSNVVYTSYVSTGVPGMETPTGEFWIDYKLWSQTMWGDDFYLPDVPYVMYFYGGYAIHGTYWHNNFGTPMSHGCVNLPTGAAGWLFNWASPGTKIWIHY